MKKNGIKVILDPSFYIYIDETDTGLNSHYKILTFREEVGEFGTLLYAGHDWKDVDLAKNSMKLMAEKVMPQINNNINIAAE